MSESEEGAQIQLVRSCLYNDELHIMSICPDYVSIRYLAPHQKIYVTLSNDNDVSNMVRLHVCLKSNIIDMMAVRKNDFTAVGMQGSHICR
ncbi:hypothetical protein CDL12_02639 [Handroanthus impetiginosus]|uniref:Uncharacterized protein n=1 Tax=Handroanthus impetiginosus TaxID=429701 RepID=A0A2G9I4D4_9LAMI|nr:hypothetical protein CDL12_02639 [Handroanthus impetiginosus]